jgi:uncharacterized protein
MGDHVLSWRSEPGALVLTVRLTPRGGRDAIDGVERSADGKNVQKVRARAPPSEGAANAALIKLMSRTLDDARRSRIYPSSVATSPWLRY